jgi:hypothetical protein
VFIARKWADRGNKTLGVLCVLVIGGSVAMALISGHSQPHPKYFPTSSELAAAPPVMTCADYRLAYDQASDLLVKYAGPIVAGVFLALFGFYRLVTALFVALKDLSMLLIAKLRTRHA